MQSRIAIRITVLLLAACTQARTPSPADSAAVAKQQDDSIIAARTSGASLLADSARHIMATLLKRPVTAVFDSLVVVQPAKVDGAWPPLVVCGRMTGRPGIDGRSTPVPFIYQNRLDVFVLQENNGPAFAALRAKDCDNSVARVLLRATAPG